MISISNSQKKVKIYC